MRGLPWHMPRTRTALVLSAALAAIAGAVASTTGPATGAPLSVAAPTSNAAVALPAAATLPRPTVTRVASGLVNPVLVRSANDGTSRLFVVEQAGRVRIVTGGSVTGTYLDIRSLVSSGGERGLLGLAFAPDFLRSRLLWVTYTRADGALVLARFGVTRANAPAVVASSRRTILVVPHPGFANHNGGDIAFGPDGYLYLGTGDGGSGGDPSNNAQNLRRLLGKMLRVDVRCAGHLYCSPASNPWATSKIYRHEIWMWGLRNPWRWSFDGTTMLIGDVGQGRYEEIDAVVRTRQRARNMGWSCREAGHVYRADRCNARAQYQAPTIEMCHPDSVSGCAANRGAEAIIGGYVYRGSASPSAAGTYVFGDYVTGRIWAYRGRTLGAAVPLSGVSGFGLDDAREIYAVTLDGGLYRVGFRVV